MTEIAYKYGETSTLTHFQYYYQPEPEALILMSRKTYRLFRPGFRPLRRKTLAGVRVKYSRKVKDGIEVVHMSEEKIAALEFCLNVMVTRRCV